MCRRWPFCHVAERMFLNPRVVGGQEDGVRLVDVQRCPDYCNPIVGGRIWPSLDSNPFCSLSRVMFLLQLKVRLETALYAEI